MRVLRITYLGRGKRHLPGGVFHRSIVLNNLPLPERFVVTTGSIDLHADFHILSISLAGSSGKSRFDRLKHYPAIDILLPGQYVCHHQYVIFCHLYLLPSIQCLRSKISSPVYPLRIPAARLTRRLLTLSNPVQPDWLFPWFGRPTHRLRRPPQPPRTQEPPLPTIP